MVRVVVAAAAKNDIQTSHDGWAENRSAEQPARWYTGSIEQSLLSLRGQSDAPWRLKENSWNKVRQLLFGLNRSRTRRIVLVIDGDDVVVLRVRHTAQEALTSDDLFSRSRLQ